MANLSGHTQDLPELYDREFVSIDRKNFDKVMERMNPTLEMEVDDTFSEGDKFRVELTFNKFEDFHPSNLIKQIPRLQKLIEEREKLMAAKRNLADPAIAKEATKAVKKVAGE